MAYVRTQCTFAETSDRARAREISMHAVHVFFLPIPSMIGEHGRRRTSFDDESANKPTCPEMLVQNTGIGAPQGQDATRETMPCDSAPKAHKKRLPR
jgi:hypothetical protein